MIHILGGGRDFPRRKHIVGHTRTCLDVPAVDILGLIRWGWSVFFPVFISLITSVL